MMRIFIGIPIDEASIEDYSNKIFSMKKQAIKAHFSEPEHLHLTLLFIGEMDHQAIEKLHQVLTQALANNKAFMIQTGDLDYFTRGNKKILWAGIQKGYKELENIADLIKHTVKNAQIPFDPYLFHPHITLARQAHVSDEWINDAVINHHSIYVKLIHVYHSHRVSEKLIYTPIYTYHLF